MEEETEAVVAKSAVPPEVEELRDKIRIDKDDLDLEVISQPDLFYAASSAHALAVSNRDQAYEGLKQTDAELNLDIREEMLGKGEKFTETLLSSIVQSHESHKEAYIEYASYKRDAEQLQALKEAFLQRSHMLRELVQLYVTGYYSESALGTDTQEARNFKQGAAKNRVRNSRRRRLSENGGDE